MLPSRGYAATIIAALCTLSSAGPSTVAPADSMITEPARLVRREPYNYNDFIGYYSDPGTDTCKNIPSYTKINILIVL